MIDSQLKGLGTALVTPFKEDGHVDFKALEQLLERQIEGGADYLVVLGTTGEAATLTTTERTEVQQFVKKQVNGRIPLVLGMGGNCTAAVCEALQTTDLSGYRAILSVCPFYNKPSQEGLFRHFCAIAEASPLPVILYNVPGRTGVNLLPETIVRILQAHPDKIVGIKEASGNVEQIKQLIQMVKGQMLVISGDDGITATLMEAGADGLISVASNAFTEDFRTIVHNRKKAQQLQKQYASLVSLLFKEGNPAGIKTALYKQGLLHNVLRLPLVPNSLNVQSEIFAEMNQLSAR